MSSPNKTAAELKQACETSALLKIWRRHRTSDDNSMAAFAEWTMNHPKIVEIELPSELHKTLESLPDGSDQEKLNFIRAL